MRTFLWELRVGWPGPLSQEQRFCWLILQQTPWQRCLRDRWLRHPHASICSLAFTLLLNSNTAPSAFFRDQPFRVALRENALHKMPDENADWLEEPFYIMCVSGHLWSAFCEILTSAVIEGRRVVGGERGASAINGGCVGDEAWPTSVLFWSVEQTVITLEGHNRVTTQPNEGSWVTLPVGGLRN